MALELVERRKLNAIRYICSADPAIDMENSDWDMYASDPLEHADALVMYEGEEPTYFVLNFELTAKEHSMIDNSKVKGYDQIAKEAKMAIGDWALTVAKLTLKDIQNPAGAKGIQFKKDGSGYVSDEVLNKLVRFGVIEEIWTLYLKLTAAGQEVKAHAKN